MTQDLSRNRTSGLDLNGHAGLLKDGPMLVLDAILDETVRCLHLLGRVTDTCRIRNQILGSAHTGNDWLSDSNETSGHDYWL